MTDKETSPSQDPTQEPNFVLPHHGVIREDNWAEYAAKGFRAVDNTLGTTIELRFSQSLYGVEHVYTGDAWDEAEGRPLRHKPGIGIYTDPDGLAIRAAAKERERHRQGRPPDDPAVN